MKQFTFEVFVKPLFILSSFVMLKSVVGVSFNLMSSFIGLGTIITVVGFASTILRFLFYLLYMALRSSSA